MKQLDIISTKIRNLEGSKNKGTYLGKKVFSKSGEQVGRVKDIIIRNDIFAGLLIQGKQKVFIDKEFIASDSGKAVMLSIDPVILTIGKQVFDVEGRKLGKCVSLERKSTANTYSAIVVKKNIITKPFIIPNGDISVSKTNIITKSAYK